MRTAIWSAALVVVMGLVGSARAGDGNPPPWRGLPLSTTQGWNFVNGVQPGQAPDPTVAPLNNPFSNPPFAPSPMIRNFSGITPSPDGGIAIAPGGYISFLIPNNIDPDTEKEIWVQLRFAGNTPRVRSQGYDPLGNAITPIVLGGAIAGPSPSSIPGQFDATFLLHLPLNPAGELVVIDNIGQAPIFLYQVVIDTICPAPGSAVAGLFAAGLAARRRRR